MLFLSLISSRHVKRRHACLFKGSMIIRPTTVRVEESKSRAPLGLVRVCPSVSFSQVKSSAGIKMSNTMAMNSESSATAIKLESTYEMVSQLASSNAVVLFSMSGCCMCTVAKRLLFGLGVGPSIVELDHHAAGPDIQAVLFHLASDGQHQPVPAVFVGGKFLGGIETLMACHINGTLVPLLKDAGALWL